MVYVRYKENIYLIIKVSHISTHNLNEEYISSSFGNWTQGHKAARLFILMSGTWQLWNFVDFTLRLWGGGGTLDDPTHRPLVAMAIHYVFPATTDSA